MSDIDFDRFNDMYLRGSIMKAIQIPGLGEISSCIKCGACCRLSSPDLFHSDSHLIERGNIPIKYLFTMREGEPYKNPKTRKLDHLQSDIIKIKPRDEEMPSCIFHDEETQECGIYQSRPAVCRAFKCWDKRQIAPVKTSPFLTRKDLLGETGMWDLIQEHQKRCDYRKMKDYAEIILAEENQEIGKEIISMLSYDRSVRDTAIEKGKMDKDLMDFLFGRQMIVSLPLFKLKLEAGSSGRQILTRL